MILPHWTLQLRTSASIAGPLPSWAFESSTGTAQWMPYIYRLEAASNACNTDAIMMAWHSAISATGSLVPPACTTHCRPWGTPCGACAVGCWDPASTACRTALRPHTNLISCISTPAMSATRPQRAAALLGPPSGPPQQCKTPPHKVDQIWKG